MSRDALKWAGQQAVGRSTGKLVLLALAKCANNDGFAWPSVGYLAEFSGVSARTVRVELQRLRVGGWIEDSGDRRGKTKQIKVWRLRLDEPVLPLFGKSKRRLNGRSKLFGKAESDFTLSTPGKAESDFTLSNAAKGESQFRERRKSDSPVILRDSSVSNDTAGKPADPIKLLFDDGVALLTESGVKESNARSLIGAWRKGGRDGAVAVAISECRSKGISNPVEWLAKRLQGPRFVSASGYEYRGSLESIRREAERRADWGTYYAAKAALETDAKEKG